MSTAAERAAVAARKRRARVSHVNRIYGVPEPALVALERYQAAAAGDPDGPARCWGCRRATGASKALAMDHNHRTGEARMLLCGHDNQHVVGHYRDDPVALIRMGLALIQPPSRAAWTAPGHAEPGWFTTDARLLNWARNQLEIETW